MLHGRSLRKAVSRSFNVLVGANQPVRAFLGWSALTRREGSAAAAASLVYITRPAE